MKDIDNTKLRFANFRFENTEYWCDLCSSAYNDAKAELSAHTATASTPKVDRRDSSTSVSSLPASPLAKFTRRPSTESTDSSVSTPGSTAASPKTPSSEFSADKVIRMVKAGKWARHRTWKCRRTATKKNSSLYRDFEAHQARRGHVLAMHALVAKSVRLSLCVDSDYMSFCCSHDMI